VSRRSSSSLLEAAVGETFTALALVLDRTHRILVESKGTEAILPRVRASAGEPPLAALSRHMREVHGVELGSPCGARPRGGIARVLAFVVPHASSLGRATRWVTLRELSKATTDAEIAWRLYVDLMLAGWHPPTRELDVFMFGDTPQMASLLAHMVARGDKRATAGWCAAAERAGETIPWPGLVSVVTDGFGMPICAIETERVDRVRFADIDEEVAFAEGEGDRTLDDWREGHRRYFEREAKRLDLTFDDDAELFVERFRLLRVLGRAPDGAPSSVR
jgi:uncharacterized protein YhfF